MYETLLRQHDLLFYPMPTVDEAIDKLKDIESRKSTRRAQQQQRAAEAKDAASNKRKADVLEEGEKGVVAAVAAVEAGGGTAIEGNTQGMAGGNGVDSGPVATDSRISTPLSDAKPDSKPKSSKQTQKEENRVSGTKPAPQSRGHTSYLTFAFLMPL